MNDLLTFLRARYDEADEDLDGAINDTVMSLIRDGCPATFGEIAEQPWAKKRRAKIDAKRRLLAWLVTLEDKALDGNLWNIEVRDAVALLAAPYAEHPDYHPDYHPDWTP